MAINVLPSVHQKPLSAFLRGLNTHYADSVLSSLKDATAPKPAFPDTEVDSSIFARNYAAYNLLRKSRYDYFGNTPPSDDELVRKAVSGFLEVEKRCYYFNEKGYIPGTAPTSEMLAPEVVFATARRKIADFLGEFDLNEFSTRIDFSGGASTRLPRRRAAVPMKFTGQPHVSRNCALLAVSLMWHHEPWRLFCQERFGRESDPCSWVTVVPGSEYFTVPKTATSLRGACKEPELNMLCQKAIGNMIRARLKRVRIDLDDQTYNQYLASCGSRTGALATIDLESASDSVSLRLVRDLLPPSWYRFIAMTRSESVKLPDGSQHILEKVSSMGNGFTFELESLIFWALSASVVQLLKVEDKRIGVYGDDIIVHHSAANDLINVLAYCGFSTNDEKTWTSGPFRESCGKHYHYGCDVSPFFIKEDLDLVENCFHTVNSMNAWIYRVESLYQYPTDTHYYTMMKLLPKGWSYVPPHVGTKAGVIPPSVSVASGVWFCLRKQGYRFRLLHKRPRTRSMRATPAYLTWLLKSNFGTPAETSEIAISDERGMGRYKTRFTSSWADCEVRLPRNLATL